ncbi:hypothetical protein CIT14_22275, partial [Virgibacillus profundi]
SSGRFAPSETSGGRLSDGAGKSVADCRDRSGCGATEQPGAESAPAAAASASAAVAPALAVRGLESSALAGRRAARRVWVERAHRQIRGRHGRDQHHRLHHRSLARARRSAPIPGVSRSAGAVAVVL